MKGVFESATLVMKKHNLTLNNKKEIFESEKGKQYFNGKHYGTIVLAFAHFYAFLNDVILLFTHEFHLFIYSFILSFVNEFNYSFIHLFFCLFTSLLTHL